MTSVAAPVAAPTGAIRRAVELVVDRPGSVRPLAVLRIALGPVTVLHLMPFAADALRGRQYDDRFWDPYWSWAPHVPGGLQQVAVLVGVPAAVAMALGWRTRLAASATFAAVAGNLLASTVHFRHNRAFLVFLLATVALGESGRVLSLDARRRRRATGAPQGDRTTIWPLWCMRVVAASVYFASGASKLVDPDWVRGLVLWDRGLRYEAEVRATRLLPGPPGAWLADVAGDLATARWFHALTSPMAVALELFLAAALWFGRTRLLALWLAVVFHVSIELTAAVEVFSVAALAALCIWVTPDTRARTVTADPATLAWIRRLDWLGRFALVPAPGRPVSVVDRDGQVHEGRAARWLVASRLPLAFPFAFPLRPWAR